MSQCLAFYIDSGESNLDSHKASSLPAELALQPALVSLSLREGEKE